jgi:SAM-dependent methyltransferase
VKNETYNRLRDLRLENDQAGFDQAEMKPRFDRLAGRHENGTAPRAVSAFQLFQTPPELAARLVAALDLKPGARVLEPSAGLGSILDALKPCQCGEIVAVEMAANIAGELFQQDRPGLNLIQRDFLTVTPAEIGLFDAIAMNPPFHMRADIRHIQHARGFLKPGGKLAAICFDTPRRAKELGSLVNSWEHLPAGTFAKEGTHVPAVLLTITKGQNAQS